MAEPLVLPVTDCAAGIDVKAAYNTRFANGDVTELFEWVIDGSGKPRLVYYHVSAGTTIPAGAK